MADTPVGAPCADNDGRLSEPRPGSPSPSASPSRVLDSVPQLIRSVSTPSDSSFSTLSNRSRHSRASDGAASVIKRRGYMRPQGTEFADSARNRDSVMSLGSIAHMQYYFARTGLLDGKGAQLAKEGTRKKSSTEKENVDPSISTNSDELMIQSMYLHDGQSNYAISDSGLDHSVVDSPTEMNDSGDDWANPSDPIMLPPTVSTYKEKPPYIEPLPDMISLRRELKEALQNACKVLEECQKQQEESAKSGTEENNSFYEIQGIHVLDIITLAIRAAKNYYTAHANPQKLYAIRSERIVRSDLYQVLDTLKRMASRNFRGGLRLMELADIITWIESIDKLIKKEDLQEQQEAAERESWLWREGDWSGREREREWLFFKSFDADKPPLPKWPETTNDEALPSDFLKALQDGQRLVKLHNALVARSKRKFDEIKTWHNDVAKPYRMADNLRYWVKAAELRWEIKISVPALDVVNNKGPEAWREFDNAIFEWAQGVRAELTEEWRQELIRSSPSRRPPELKIEISETHVEEQKTADRNGEVAVKINMNHDTPLEEGPVRNAIHGIKADGGPFQRVAHEEQPEHKTTRHIDGAHEQELPAPNARMPCHEQQLQAEETAAEGVTQIETV
ncbi:Hypothetical protein R9X50_00329600 [Acrodontium crateriforme]|uniref:Uncharacterized protein n=1 Tax=Acrodontium crateriforme TaxID=150365 RepID=A0AAQ3M8S0_9PEZI|nr:Hypothetical protein R9X50_00329600 [Acrodontium crateriforme]